MNISRAGFYFKSSCVVVQCKQNNYCVSRTGFTASKKVGNAVMRNKCKRRLREIARSLSAVLLPGVDYVFIAKKSTGSIQWSVLFNSCLKSIEYLNMKVKN